MTKDGYIITNNHVIENASEVEVLLNDNRTFIASIEGTDPTTDIAVLKGSALLTGLPLPVLTEQKPQDRVQVSPSIIIVAVPLFQHS